MPVSRSFVALWTAQFISLIATDMTKHVSHFGHSLLCRSRIRFALRIWTYESTGSVTQFALVHAMQSHNRAHHAYPDYLFL